MLTTEQLTIHIIGSMASILWGIYIVYKRKQKGVDTHILKIPTHLAISFITGWFAPLFYYALIKMEDMQRKDTLS